MTKGMHNAVVKAQRIYRAMEKQDGLREQYRREQRDARKRNWFENTLKRWVHRKIAEPFVKKVQHVRREGGVAVMN